MEFGTNLLQYAKNNNMNQKELAKKLQENEKTISSYIVGNSAPTYKKLVKICNKLNCDANTLMNGDIEYQESTLQKSEEQLLQKYNQLSDSDRRVVDFILDGKENNIQEPNQVNIYRFPVFKQSAAAGVGDLSNPENYKMNEFIVDDIPSTVAFAMYINGDSMHNTIPDNATVLVEPVKYNYVCDKDIVIASLDNKIVCKRYILKSDHILFLSDNKYRQYENKDSRNFNECKIIGKVLGYIENEKFVPVK